MVEHVHGGGEQHALIGLAGAPADDLGEEGFAHAGIADKDRWFLWRETPDRAAAECGFQIEAALVVFEVKAVDGVLRVQAREAEPPFNRTAVAAFEFEVELAIPAFAARLRFRAAASAIV